MRSPYTQFNTRHTPVSEPILGSSQVENSTGGYVWSLDTFKALERFLILGSEGGSYYIGEKKLTREGAVNTIKAIELDGRKAVDLIVNVSDNGRAVKNDPAIFALALAASAKDLTTRTYALDNLSKVCRIPTHLFHFFTMVKQFRGRGRGLKTALRAWYSEKDVKSLAYTMVKYQQRDGVSHADILRCIRPNVAGDKERNALYRWAVDGLKGLDDTHTVPYAPNIVLDFENGKNLKKLSHVVSLIKDAGLSREMVPTEWLKEPSVWEALLVKMPPHAMLRNLGNMSKCGLLKPLSAASKFVVDKLTGEGAVENYRKNRVHPISILLTMKQYESGHGDKGKGVWTPVPAIVDALDEAFYLAFKAIEPTGKRFLFGIDCSGSMEWASSNVAGTSLMSSEAAAAMALAVMKTEKNSYAMGFGSTFKDLGITPRMRLTEATNKVREMTFGATRCALPMEWALREKVPVDVFVVITDNEVNHGGHPAIALRDYRQGMGIAAKQVILGTVATPFTIADPNDPSALDIAGFDANVPTAINEFARI